MDIHHQKPPLGSPINLSKDIARGRVLDFILNDGTGAELFDLSGHTNHGAINGATWARGETGHTLTLDGDNDEIVVSDAGSLDLAEFSIFAKIRVTELSRPNSILSKGSYGLKVRPDKKLALFGRAAFDGTTWTAVEDTAENYILSLVVFNGYIYAGTNPNGKIYRSSDGTTWAVVEDTVETNIYSLAVFNGFLYAGTGNAGKIYRSSDGTTWAMVEDTAESQIFSLGVFNGFLYAGTGAAGKIYRSSDGTTWAVVEDTAEISIYSLAVFDGFLYAGTGNAGKIYRSSDGTTWAAVADTPEMYVHSLTVFNGYIYAGTGTAGKIYRSSDGTTWAEVEDTVESRIYSLGVFNGFLYAGTGDVGKIYRGGGGFDLYASSSLDSEWHTLLGTYKSGEAKLYIDGVEDASDTPTVSIEATTRNVLIGNSYGSEQGGYSSSGEENFKGDIELVTLWDRVLTSDEAYIVSRELYAKMEA